MTRSISSLRRRLGALCAGLALIAIRPTAAIAADKTCMPQARGVPYLNGPPNWLHSTPDRNQDWDDPRWRGSMGLSYSSVGTANPPVLTRAAWGNEGGNRYVYLQWIIRAAILDQPHMLIAGFRRPGGLAAGEPRAVMVQLNLAPSTATGFVKPTFCEDGVGSSGAACGLASMDLYSVFLDNGNTGSCATLSGTSNAEFVQQSAGYGWIDESVHYQRQCSGSGPTATCDRWVVSLRIPVVTTAGFTDGVHENDQLWYELRLPTSAGLPPCTGMNPCMLIDSWPRTPPPVPPALVVDPLCRLGGAPATWYHAGLGLDTNWSTLDIAPGSPGGAGCFGGLKLTADDIGVLVNAGTPKTSLSAPLEWLFKAPSTTLPAVNRVIARPRNDTAADISGVLKARFRIAAWGAEGIGAAAAWTEVRGTNTACMEDPTQANRTCTSSAIAIPGSTTQPNAALRKGAISFEWRIGSDPTLGPSESCQFGIAPVGGTCGDCQLAPGPACSGTTCGTAGTVGATTGPCLRKLHDHQCVLVDLDSTSGVNFESTSVARNMNIAAMSETAQEAWITSRGLPVAPNQKLEEIYLVVMPRNIASSLPVGTTGLGLIQQEARDERDRIARPYVEAAARLAQNPGLLEEAIAAVRQNPDLDPADPVVFDPPGHQVPPQDLPREALLLMQPGVRAAVEFLDGAIRYQGGEGRPDGFGGVTYGAAAATDLMLDTLDDASATAILPTLDIYAYRHVPGASGMSAMSSFTLVVHHEGPLDGITWEIDGATRLGRNLFKIEMPVGHRKQILIRAMAHEGGGAQTPGNRSWPCAGGCCGRAGYCSEPDLALGYMLPIGIAGVVMGGLGRRRSKRKKTAPRAEG